MEILTGAGRYRPPVPYCIAACFLIGSFYILVNEEASRQRGAFLL